MNNLWKRITQMLRMAKFISKQEEIFRKEVENARATATIKEILEAKRNADGNEHV